MQMLLLYYSDNRLFDLESVRRILESESGFCGVRFDEPDGALIEGVLAEDHDSTIVRLSGNRRTVTLSGQSVAARMYKF